MERYLNDSTVIDWRHPDVVALAAALALKCGSHEDTAKNCFEWVRDNIRHSWDDQLNPVTLKASEVLKFRTGFCYAKSHLLAALLRANDIPSGFCYQRLKRSTGAGYALHGLVAVFLPEHGWYRLDARGNKAGVDARFTPSVERLAYPAEADLVVDLPEILPEPLEAVVEILRRYTDIRDVYDNLPDLDATPPVG